MSPTLAIPVLLGPDKSEGAIELDIFVYMAHLRLSELDLSECVDRMLVELEWASLPVKISVIVADDFKSRASLDKRVNLIPAAKAASAFRLRCREIEAAPHDVAVCFGAFLPSVDVIGQLRKTLRDDGMASAVAPRIAIEPDGHLVMLGDHYDGDSPALIAREQHAARASIDYLPEDLFPCFCIHEKMIGNVDLPDQIEYFPDLVLAFLRAGRRRGLLLLVDNRAVIPVSGYTFNKRAFLDETTKTDEHFAEDQAVKKRLAQHPAIAEERRMRILAGVRDRSRHTLLLDCTNMQPTYNGTTVCVLGVLKGITQVKRNDWAVSAMVSDEARKFFHLDEQFPTIRFVPTSDPHQFNVGIRLSQAWTIASVQDLSRRARSIAITILDTIGPEIIYSVPDGAEETFQFVGEHADGLVYISEYSRQQFRRRYFTRPDLIEAVIHLSLDPRDYRSAGKPNSPEKEEWILLFGNEYDHKDLSRTIDILATAFPFEKIKVVGARSSALSNVEGFSSGLTKADVINNLYRRAKCVVFPSFYEGFGFPVVTGLAHGKTVIARSSSLLREIARDFPNVGRLVEYRNSLDLVPIVATLLRGLDCPSIPLRDNPIATGQPYGWLACGERFIEFARQLKVSEKPDRWLQRDRALRYVFAAR